MNNGFIPPIRQGEVARLERTLDRIDSGEAPELIHKWVDRQIKKMGDRGFRQWIDTRVVKDLGQKLSHRLDKAMLATLPDDLKKGVFDKAQAILFQDLIKQGFAPGEDFSRSSDGFMFSDEALEHLMNHVPDECKDEILGELQSVHNCPWSMLEDRLGTPFRANLMLRAEEFIDAKCPPAAVAGWLTIISQGISSQVVGDPESLDLFIMLVARLKSKSPEVYQQVWMALESDECWDGERLMDYGICPMVDVLRAAGGSESDGCVSPDGEALSRKGLERLALVWRGDRFSVTELIAMMDQHLGNGGQAA